MKRKKENSDQFAIQLQIDFLLPYELTPTLEDLRYEFSIAGSFSAPCSVVEFKKKKKNKLRK